MKIVFHDDATARGFEPFALTRPISTLVAGVMPIAARWEVLGAEPAGFLGADHLADFEHEGFAEVAEPKQGTIIATSRFAPALATKFDDKADVWTAAGRVVAVRLERGLRAADIRAGNIPLESLAKSAAHMAEIDGWWMGEVWDLLRHLPEMLAADLTHIARSAGKKTAPPAHSTVLGKNPVMVFDALIEPQVVFDTTAGPIFIDRGAHIHGFTRIAGPCYIGADATILGGDILACSIGPVSKIRGEISGTFVHGYS